MLLKIVYIIIGFSFLILGANLLVKGASNIAKKFNVSEMLIGLTIVALGTSLPELIVTITSANKGAGELILGNAIGSNICNLLLVLGLTALIKPIKIQKQVKNIHIPVLLVVTIFVLLMGRSTGIGLANGIILLILFVLYFLYSIIDGIKNVQVSIAYPYKKSRIFLSILSILIGIILLKYGGDLVVDNSINIAELFNISKEFIGLTIIGLGTSFPELVTSIVAGIKGEQELAVGNIIGSCIFNLLLILGAGAVIIPLKVSTGIYKNLKILICITILIFLFGLKGRKNHITRIKGGILLVIFCLYSFLL